MFADERAFQASSTISCFRTPFSRRILLMKASKMCIRDSPCPSRRRAAPRHWWRCWCCFPASRPCWRRPPGRRSSPVSYTHLDIGKINRLVVIGIDYFPFYTETRGRHGRIANTQQGQQETKTLLHFLHWFVNNATKIGFSYERNRIFAARSYEKSVIYWKWA